MDLMNVKKPVTIKFTKAEPSSSKEAEEEGIKGRIRKPDDNEDNPDTKSQEKQKPSTTFHPKLKRWNSQRRRYKQENKGQKPENWQMKKFRKRTRLNIEIR